MLVKIFIAFSICHTSLNKYVLVHGAMGCGQKSLKVVWQCYKLLYGYLAKGHLPRVSRLSHLSANVEGDNRMIPGVVQRSPEEDPDEGYATSHRLKWGSLLPN